MRAMIVPVVVVAAGRFMYMRMAALWRVRVGSMTVRHHYSLRRRAPSAPKAAARAASVHAAALRWGGCGVTAHPPPSSPESLRVGVRFEHTLFPVSHAKPLGQSGEAALHGGTQMPVWLSALKH